MNNQAHCLNPPPPPPTAHGLLDPNRLLGDKGFHFLCFKTQHTENTSNTIFQETGVFF